MWWEGTLQIWLSQKDDWRLRKPWTRSGKLSPIKLWGQGLVGQERPAPRPPDMDLAVDSLRQRNVSVTSFSESVEDDPSWSFSSSSSSSNQDSQSSDASPMPGPGSWENGIFIQGHVEGTPINFLIDTGATVTVLSFAAFERIPSSRRPALQRTNTKVSGVGGSSLDIAGMAEMTLVFEGVPIIHKVIVIDIQMDAILGQDIMLSHHCRLDLSKLTLGLKGKTLSCWTPGETALSCRVLVKEETVLPPWSEKILPVTVTNAGYLATNGIIQPSPEVITEQEILLIPGVVSTHGESVQVRVINFGDYEVTLHPKQNLGTCESYYDQSSSGPAIMAAAELRCIQEVSTTLTDTLEKMVIESSTEMSSSERRQWADLVERYRGIFASSKADLGRTSLVRHQINTGTTVPIRIPPRRLPLGKRRIEQEEVKTMLEKGVIQPSTSPWAAPIVLVTKKDGTTHFCVDYLALNCASVKDAYPLPRIDDSLDALNGGRYFCTMDLMSGFWQIKMHPKDQEKTAFSTSIGLYDFKVMPFGLVNAPATFERLMETVLRGLQWEECLVYMDDIIVAGDSISQCLERLEHVFQRLQEAGLKLKPSKCNFFQKEVHFIGHVVSEEGIHTDPGKIAVVQDWPVPTTQKQVRSFLGLCSYYRRFIKGFADIARPLHKLTEKTSRYEWNDLCQQSFDVLKKALTSAPILSYPKPQGQFILDTDASHEAVGAVLSQVQDEVEHVLGYFSKSLSKTERVYCVTRKELLAVVMALKHFHPYLYGRKVILRTDNSAVSWMRSLKAPKGQTARWLERVAEYDLEVVHRARKSHGNADALSRRPCASCTHQEQINQDASRDEELESATPSYKPCVTSTPKEQIGDTIDEEEPEDAAWTLPSPQPEQALQTMAEDELSGPEVTDDSTPHVRVTTRQQSAPIPDDLRHNQGWLQGWEMEKIRQSQVEDPIVGPFLLHKEEMKPKPTWMEVSAKCEDYKALWSQWDRLEVRGSLLFRRFEGSKPGSPRWQLIVPREKQKEVFTHMHDHRTGGHLGSAKTLEKVQLAFYWPRMRTFIENLCRQCDHCAAREPASQSTTPAVPCGMPTGTDSHGHHWSPS